jgi:dolichol-phosphate mannosyltransferase
MTKLSVCITAHNEEHTIGDLIWNYVYLADMLNIELELILLDNGSTDDTYKEMEKELSYCKWYNPAYKLIKCNLMLEYNDAYSTILGIASGDYIFVTDADGQYDPIDFLQLWNYRKYVSVATGVKVHREDSLFRVIESKMFHAFVGFVMGKQFKDPDCGFRLYSRVATDELKWLDLMRYSPGTEALYKINHTGLDIVEIPVRHYKRMYGKSKVSNVGNFIKMFREQLLGLVKLRVELL